MRRREFIAAAGAAALWPLATHAETGRPKKIGIFLVGATLPARDLEIVKELAKLGYVDGRNVTYAIRGDDGTADLDRVARDLVGSAPDILVGAGSDLAYSLVEATHDIPIVVTAVADPVDTGLTGSLSRPTRNVTGFTISSTSLATKRLDMLRQLVPGLHKVGWLWSASRVMSALQVTDQLQRAAAQFGLDLVSLPVRSGAEIASAFEQADKEGAKAILTDANPLSVQFGAIIADECQVRDLPLMDPWPSQIQNGALAAYGPARVENLKGAAAYVDRILKGARLADLPFVEPTEVKLAINLKTARSIGVTVPANLLALADEVIE
ncbi:MAG TPA: ABC transporter substrate-binding protein [Alphaproteobacteria bacterium]|nr:ABC transporter substrate-binding protein [Alphaproteobacteria bacterium]